MYYMYSLFRWHLINETQRELPTIYTQREKRKRRRRHYLEIDLKLSVSRQGLEINRDRAKVSQQVIFACRPSNKARSIINSLFFNTKFVQDKLRKISENKLPCAPAVENWNDEIFEWACNLFSSQETILRAYRFRLLRESCTITR